jgi:hypothetical protein
VDRRITDVPVAIEDLKAQLTDLAQKIHHYQVRL